jgi:hypothetical protein
MDDRYAAYAEGPIGGCGTLNSLGWAGFERDGSLKPPERRCTSEARAKRSALKTIANQMRYSRKDGTVGIEFRHLAKEIQRALLDEVEKSVSWEIISPTIYTTRVSESMFHNAMQKVVG